MVTVLVQQEIMKSQKVYVPESGADYR